MLEKIDTDELTRLAREILGKKQISPVLRDSIHIERRAEFLIITCLSLKYVDS
jgi:hypothetical protein